LLISKLEPQAAHGDTAEVVKHDKNITRVRREILDGLNTDELRKLSEQELLPEACVKVLKPDPAPWSPPTWLQKAQMDAEQSRVAQL
jgi:hypothetical protein